MNLQRVFVLVKPYLRKMIESHHLPSLPITIRFSALRLNIKKTINSSYLYFPLILLVGLLLSTLIIGWNGKNLTLFQFFPLLGYGGDKDKALLSALHECFAWTWILISLFWLFPGLLQPLGDSFLVSQSLWLRFTCCLPCEVALARAIWVISWGGFLGILGSIWAIVSALSHHISPNTLLVDVGGLVSYILLSGGIVSALDFDLAVDNSGRRLLSTVALLASPFILLPIYTLLLHDVGWARFYPYAVPFALARRLGDATFHYGMASVVGIVLLSLHVITKVRYSVENVTVEKIRRT